MFSRLFSNNYEQTIIAVMVACLLPIVLSSLAKINAGFSMKDNENPRGFLANASGMSQRANAAHKNGFEVLPFFIASVFFAMYLVVPVAAVNQLAWTFVFLRLLYSLAYLLNKPMLRSALWFLSMACPFLIFKLCLTV